MEQGGAAPGAAGGTGRVSNRAGGGKRGEGLRGGRIGSEGLHCILFTLPRLFLTWGY